MRFAAGRTIKVGTGNTLQPTDLAFESVSTERGLGAEPVLRIETPLPTCVSLPGSGSTLLPKNWGQGSQRFVYGATVREHVKHVRVDHGNVCPLCVSSRRHASNSRREVVFGSHRVSFNHLDVTLSPLLH